MGYGLGAALGAKSEEKTKWLSILQETVALE